MTSKPKKKPLSAAQKRKQAERRKPKRPEPARSPNEANARMTSSDNPGGPNWHAQIRTAASIFRQAIPQEAVSSGWCRMPEGGTVYGDVPDGTYRVAGDDWLLTFKDRRLAEVGRAQPPHYGEPGVVHIPNS